MCDSRRCRSTSAKCKLEAFRSAITQDTLTPRSCLRCSGLQLRPFSDLLGVMFDIQLLISPPSEKSSQGWYGYQATFLNARILPLALYVYCCLSVWNRSIGAFTSRDCNAACMNLVTGWDGGLNDLHNCLAYTLIASLLSNNLLSDSAVQLAAEYEIENTTLT